MAALHAISLGPTYFVRGTISCLWFLFFLRCNTFSLSSLISGSPFIRLPSAFRLDVNIILRLPDTRGKQKETLTDARFWTVVVTLTFIYRLLDPSSATASLVYGRKFWLDLWRRQKEFIILQHSKIFLQALRSEFMFILRIYLFSPSMV